MEISINLLPSDITARWEQERKQRLLLAAGGMVLIILIAAYSALTIAAIQTRNEFNKLQKERQALENTAKAYAQYATLQTQIAQTEKILGRAMGTPPDWTRVMAEIELYMPPDVWITEFVATVKTDHEHQNPTGSADNQSAEPHDQAQAATTTGDLPSIGEVTLKGWASDYPSVATWLEEINKVSGLTDIRCHYSSKEDLEGQSMVGFEIKASLLSGPAYRTAAGKK